MQILKLLGPKEAAKLAVICKSWKLIVSDNMLWIYFLRNKHVPWDSMFFAETNLRSGYPLRWFWASGYCNFHWSKYGSPSGRASTFMEFENIESPVYSRLRHFFSTIYSRFSSLVKSSLQPTVVSIPISQYGYREAARSARIDLLQLKKKTNLTTGDTKVPKLLLLLISFDCWSRKSKYIASAG